MTQVHAEISIEEHGGKAVSIVQYFPKQICGLTGETTTHKIRVQATSESVLNGHCRPIGILRAELAVKLKYK